MMIGGTSAVRFSLNVFMAMYCSKMPLYLVFEATSGELVEMQLLNFLPDGIVSCF